MLEVRLQPDSGLQCPPLAFSDSGVSSPLDWSVSFEFRAETLKHFNPLPHVLQLLLEVHDLRARGGALYTVLAELYSNALEHGVIGLDSTMKSDAAGFARYYQERVSRLQALRDGYVRLHLTWRRMAGASAGAGRGQRRRFRRGARAECRGAPGTPLRQGFAPDPRIVRSLPVVGRRKGGVRGFSGRLRHNRAFVAVLLMGRASEVDFRERSNVRAASR